MRILFSSETGRVTGYTRDPLAQGGLEVDRLPDNPFHYRVVDGELVIDTEFFRSEKMEVIASQSREQINALSWRIERAQERDKIGAEGETVADVLAEREAIRRASNRAEAELGQLTTIEEIEAFTWEVLPEDYPENTTMTRLQFMRQFTDAERATIRAARDSGQSQDLLDFWELLQLASSVNLNDADIRDGVVMLEANGLIGAGRADEILAIT